jgi:hypothetical protein
MNKNRFFLIPVFFVVLIVIGLISIYSVKWGVCALDDFSCRQFFTFSLGKPLLFLSAFYFVLSVIILMFPLVLIQKWIKLTMFVFPLTALWVFTRPTGCSQSLGVCLNKELTAIVAGILVSLLSALFVIIYFARRRNKAK